MSSLTAVWAKAATGQKQQRLKAQQLGGVWKCTHESILFHLLLIHQVGPTCQIFDIF